MQFYSPLNEHEIIIINLTQEAWRKNFGLLSLQSKYGDLIEIIVHICILGI